MKIAGQVRANGFQSEHVGVEVGSAGQKTAQALTDGFDTTAAKAKRVSKPEAPPATGFHIENSVAGIDYPTEVPPRKFNVWVTADARIPVGNVTKIESARAGLDYPTDGPPNMNRQFSVFVASGKRVPSLYELKLEPSVAGIDFPTDVPPRDFEVLAFDQTRLPVADISAIEKAQAGIDYPTDGPPSLRRNFYVIVATNGDRYPL